MTYQIWPDAHYFVDQKGRILNKATYSYRSQGTVDIDYIWLIEFIENVRN